MRLEHFSVKHQGVFYLVAAIECIELGANPKALGSAFFLY